MHRIGVSLILTMGSCTIAAHVTNALSSPIFPVHLEDASTRSGRKRTFFEKQIGNQERGAASLKAEASVAYTVCLICRSNRSVFAIVHSKKICKNQVPHACSSILGNEKNRRGNNTPTATHSNVSFFVNCS